MLFDGEDELPRLDELKHDEKMMDDRDDELLDGDEGLGDTLNPDCELRDEEKGD